MLEWKESSFSFCLLLEEKAIVRGDVVKFAAKKLWDIQALFSQEISRIGQWPTVHHVKNIHLGQCVFRGRCSMKIEARLEVGLERPTPSTAITPTRYLGTLSEERSAAGEFGILKKSSSFLKIFSTLFCLRNLSAWCSVFSCFHLISYFYLLTQIWGISSFPKQKMKFVFEISHFPTWILFLKSFQPGTGSRLESTRSDSVTSI